MKKTLIIFISLINSFIILSQSNWYDTNFNDSKWNMSVNPWNNAPGSQVPNSLSMWDPDGGELAIFRKTFSLDELPQSATLEISVDNVYMVIINNYEQQTGGAILSDGKWRSIETYDIKESLKVGENILVIIGLDMGDYEGVFAELKIDSELMISSYTDQWRSKSIILNDSEDLYNLPFRDDFSTDKGWINETNGDFVINNDQVEWNADRDIVQKMYIPISEYEGDFELQFDYQITDRQSNIWLEVGLANAMSGAYSDPVNDPLGTFLTVGWTGGGTAYSAYYIRPGARYPDKETDQPYFDHTDPSTYLSFTEDEWYTIKMEVVGQNWRITVYDSNGNQTGQKAGLFSDPLNSYNYIYLCNSDDEDWPEGNGYLDNLSVTNEVSWEVSSLDISNNIYVNLYPNPSDDLISIKTNFNKTASISIINHIGQEVYNNELVHGSSVINLKDLSKGIYLFVLKDEKNTIIHSQNIIKK
ncbi:T9SS type A sorting domain-containing protein [Saccharicrinis sp. FJH2]|uniref:T9SS type A sorting domain-containing protein n=1 Tax=Saccharicrinis sp. FJH65 TaxID=3344659 RepID=UPI0035F264CA